MNRAMDFHRQLDIISPTQFADYKVTVIGAGGIGSPVILALAKMGVKDITVLDDDTVEPHNLPNQLYRFNDIGKLKVEAIDLICQEFAGVEIHKTPERFNGQPLSGIVISGVDSMTARKEIWEKVRWNIKVPLYIEARMGAEVARIHTLRPFDLSQVKWYEGTLYDEDKAWKLPCTARAIAYNIFIIAGLIANQTKKFVKGEDIAKEIIFDCVNVMLTKQ